MVSFVDLTNRERRWGLRSRGGTYTRSGAPERPASGSGEVDGDDEVDDKVSKMLHRRFEIEM
jgi:hypothetical protein